MALIHLPAARHANVPWKNGLGVSRIIATEPPGAGYDALHWQVGGTEITADSPFSSLPDLDRLFMVTEGDGVELTSIDEHGATRTTPVYAMLLPYAFRGDWKTDCRLLGGPVKVFNVIARRGKASARVEFLDGRTLTKSAGETVLAVHLRSLEAWMLSGPGSETAAISPPPGPVALIRIAS
jgi:environmental stress-induced protein Ves